ncbi:hypothetical protein FHS43_002499 [Streptosporangium becharense]|uniref:Uncharacterized protein n=1 Tax=Streptosporangium becharense TaxID=1816182 RepID=A0A7W9IKD2_9ACTN|nr:hypothetical protein [Streptosporangium becharense]MBB2911234.1 hypothetical protein [Streptosporangium becharense]MBB5821708.1 hypothetical protein [Streptosporangium becharense]
MTARRRTPASTLLAGWLFADLLLGLTIIMLGAQAPPPVPTPSPVEAVRLPPGATGAPDDGGRPVPDTVPSLPGVPLPSPAPARPLTEDESPSRSPEDDEDPANSPEQDDDPAPARSGPSPAPSPCAGRVGGVRAKPITIAFRVTPGATDDVLAAQVRQEVGRHRDRLAGQHAGMVLTFGADAGTGNGVHLATRVNEAVREAYPGIFGTAVTRNFHDLAAPSGSISMEIYPVTYGCSPTPEAPGE